jgi:hypothetical protein
VVCGRSSWGASPLLMTRLTGPPELVPDGPRALPQSAGRGAANASRPSESVGRGHSCLRAGVPPRASSRRRGLTGVVCGSGQTHDTPHPRGGVGVLLAPPKGMSVAGRWRRLLSDTYKPPDRVAPRAPLDYAAFDVGRLASRQPGSADGDRRWLLGSVRKWGWIDILRGISGTDEFKNGPAPSQG